MIQEAFTYVAQIQDMDVKLKLIDTLIAVTSGKVYTLYIEWREHGTYSILVSMGLIQYLLLSVNKYPTCCH